MRIIILSLFVTICCFSSHAQINADTLVYEESDTFNVYVKPEFPNGNEAFSKYMCSRIIYPRDALSKGIKGKTFTEFIIEKDGTLSHIKTVAGKSLSPSCDQAVIDILLKSPRWKPGLGNNGQPIRVKKTIEFKFSLN